MRSYMSNVNHQEIIALMILASSSDRVLRSQECLKLLNNITNRKTLQCQLSWAESREGHDGDSIKVSY